MKRGVQDRSMPVLMQTNNIRLNINISFHREYLSKDKINFLEEEDPPQVYYRQRVNYIFDNELSAGDEDDLITTVNIIAAVSN